MPIEQWPGQSVADFVAYINRTFKTRFRDNGTRGFRIHRRETKKRWLKRGLREELLNLICWDVKQDRDGTFTWEDMIEAAKDAEYLFNLKYPPDVPRVSKYNACDFAVDRDGYAIVYTDGACPGNGTANATAGIGVYFGPGNALNVSKPLGSHLPCTNNVAEIVAVLTAIELAKDNDAYRVAVHTDSHYLYKSMTDYLHTWLRNGWKRSDGNPVKHRDIYRKLLEASKNMAIHYVHIAAHSTNSWNNAADSLARAGARQYAISCLCTCVSDRYSETDNSESYSESDSDNNYYSESSDSDYYYYF